MTQLGITKITESFYNLIISEGFDHTSVKNIMKNADMRRQTFYNYFLDKYDLLTWFTNYKLSEVIDKNINYLDWQNIIRLTCFEIFSHRKFYKDIIKSQTEVDIINILAKHLTNLVIKTYNGDNFKFKNFELIELLILGISYQLITNIISNSPLRYEKISETAITSLELIIH